MKGKKNASKVPKMTLIDEISATASAGKFDNLDFGPVEDDGETVIGIMTDTEKAVFSLFTKKKDEIRILGCTPRNQMSNSMDRRIKVLEKQCKALEELSWTLLQERLDKPETSLGVRAGFKIVEMSESHAIQMARRDANPIRGMFGF